MQKLNYLELGGTLFIPASHKALEDVLLKQKYPELKSLVIDTEDGLDESALKNALKSIEMLLPKIQNPTLPIFLRPRNLAVLETLLKMQDIQNIWGFILPKFSLVNAETYLRLLDKTEHYIMPSIEGKELFNPEELRELKDKLLNYKNRVLLVRFGLEDMLSHLGMRRRCEESIFDISVTNVVLGNFIAIFKSEGFGISGGVYPCFKDKSGFKNDVKRDIREGLFTKTIIHPNQIELLNELYKVTEAELFEAQKILKTDQAVFSLDEKMAETSTMKNHSLSVLQRSKIYGVLN